MTSEMSSTRLEAFSDGVIAIIITIMVLELKAPHADTPDQLLALWPVFLSYVLSYLMVAIYWVNHHRLFHLVKTVDTRVLWSNILLLFCLSLVPFSTAYMGENHLASFATAVYAAVLLLCALAYLLMTSAMARRSLRDPDFARQHRAATVKNLAGIALYTAAVPAAYAHPAISLVLIAIVGAMYFAPEAWMGSGK